ncbi:glycosyltransferase family 2 protein [Parabacteroides sp. FAFU027]|uniref:glycosyltransferase family 2 protein n=1 Tax=Parabacteroides sp. FAFU027 TaxID=2922715 RepID=UPI001FAEABBA|nr:glycosyltransferase family 2 protein [Parabacteroides sp. FAFU027]
MSKKIGIVTVLYNSQSVLDEFFETLERQLYRDFILYVVDNKSPDNSLNLSKDLSQKTTFKTVIIENDYNYGVAKGNNIGIKAALKDDCDYILLSNNDIRLEDDTISNLMLSVVKENALLAVPKIYYYGSNKIWCAGGEFTKRSGMTRHYHVREEDLGQCDTQKIVAYSPTCFIVIAKEVFNKIGIMDEEYFVYFDDTDFMYRAYKAKIPLHYFPNSKLYHKESVSTGYKSPFSIYYHTRNILLFNSKFRSKTYLYYMIVRMFVFLTVKLPFSANKNTLKSGYKGLYDGIKLCFRKY